jgi:chromosome segregation ATPase
VITGLVWLLASPGWFAATSTHAADAGERVPFVSAVEEAEASRARWAARSKEASDRVAKATAAVEKAQDDWERMRTRNYPRGEARAKLLENREDATTELTAAEEALAALAEEARAADVPPGWLESDDASALPVD